MDSLCPNIELCGSCGWSHIPYEKQLGQKLNDINYSFEIHKHDFRVNKIVPSPKTSHYRNRMDFVIDFEGRVGLRQKGKWWRVIDNHTCFIAGDLIEELFHTVRDWVKTSELTFYDRKSHLGLLRYAVIRQTTTNEAMVTIVTSSPKDYSEAQHLSDKLNELTQLMTAIEQASRITLIHAVNETDSDVSHGGVLKTIFGDGYITEVINGFKYRITPNAFFQTNLYTAKLLMDTVLEFAELALHQPSQPSQYATILDLYCGSGFFTFPLSRLSKKTVGVEIVEEAIRDAEENNRLNDTQVEFIAAPTEDYDWGVLNPDLVILDPPRSGLHKKVISQLETIKPQALIYVSCNYKNFSRDMEELKSNYEVVKMSAVDMFPHTPHVELVTLLRLI